MKKTKIICTIGPVTADEKSLKKLVDSGMNIARLNGSHNTVDWHKSTIQLIRSINPHIAILLDLPGRKIRTKLVDYEHHFCEGDNVVFTTDQECDGIQKIALNYENLHKLLKKKNRILADDGTLEFEVIAVEERDIHCIAKVSGSIKPSKGINVPFIKMDSPLVSQSDIKLIELCKNESVDFIGVSFVDSGEQLKEVYKYIEGSSLEVIAKVENQFGMENLNSIVDNSFGILIDRGDLSAETNIVQLPIMQKQIIKAANRLGKPVIVATEMLHTMIENPFPTKSEVNDIANAILDGASAIMLSGETAAGKHPFAACKMMKDVAEETERELLYQSIKHENVSKDISGIIAKSIFSGSKELDITKIIAITYSGFAARMIALQRPQQEIIVITDTQEKTRQFNLLWGVSAYVGNFTFIPTDSYNSVDCLKMLYKSSILDKSDRVILTGVKFPNPRKNTTMNYIEIHNISDLIETFSWDE